MQSEWDSLLLESFKLRSDLDATRQELSHALHQYDAACRVICRLIKERDEARRDLAQQGEVRVMPQQFETKIQRSQFEERKEAKPKEPQEKFAEDLDKMYSHLSQQRVAKELPPANPVPESRYSKPKGSQTTIEVAGGGRLTSVDIDPLCKHVLAAGEGGCFLYDIEKQKLNHSLTHHKAPISEAVFSPANVQGGKQVMLMSSRDSNATLAVYSGQSSYTIPIMLKKESSPLTACKYSTLTDYAIFGAEDGNFAVHNVTTCQTLSVIKDPNAGKGGISTLSVHPDGVILATGSSTGVVTLWDLRSNSEIGVIKTAAQNQVTSLDFSNKGIYLASATKGCDIVEIWDARHFGEAGIKSKPVKLSHFSEASDIRYDISGKVLAAAGQNGIEMYKSKGWKSLGLLSNAKNLSSLEISENGELIASVSYDGKLYLNHV